MFVVPSLQRTTSRAAATVISSSNAAGVGGIGQAGVGGTAIITKNTTIRTSSVLIKSVLKDAADTSTDESSTSSDNNNPIAADGRHEVWREDIYDHDNEPK